MQHVYGSPKYPLECLSKLLSQPISYGTSTRPVLFTVRGSVTGAVEPARSDVLLFSHPTGDGGLRIAVFGHGLSGRLVRLPVPDVAEAPSYGLSIQEVAGPRNRLRADLGAYRLAVAR
jgi:hypothetical protein